MALVRLGTHWVPSRLGVSAPSSVFLTQTYSAPACATTGPAHTLSSGHSLCVGYVLHSSFSVLFACQSAAPHGILLPCQRYSNYFFMAHLQQYALRMPIIFFVLEYLQAYNRSVLERTESFPALNSDTLEKWDMVISKMKRKSLVVCFPIFKRAQ